MKQCRYCGVGLVPGDTWWLSCAARSDKMCSQCGNARIRAANAANPERRRAVQRAHEARHPERRRESRRRWRAEHGAAAYAKQKLCRQAARKPRTFIGRQESSRRYYAKNKTKWVAAREGRLAALVAATPKWANLFFIEEAYLLATLRNRLTGIRWEVDHIVPLVHPLVCGLHTEANLAVIPKVENRRKGNRFWPDMPR